MAKTPEPEAQIPPEPPPNEGRTLADLQRDAEVWIREKWSNGDPVCPMCGHNVWLISTPVMLDYEEPNVSVPGALRSVLPLLPVACENCANTQFLRIDHAGIAPMEGWIFNPHELGGAS